MDHLLKYGIPALALLFASYAWGARCPTGEFVYQVNPMACAFVPTQTPTATATSTPTPTSTATDTPTATPT